MAKHPTDGTRDHTTTQHDDKRLRALRDILTILAHGVSRKIHDEQEPRHDAHHGQPPDNPP